MKWPPRVQWLIRLILMISLLATPVDAGAADLPQHPGPRATQQAGGLELEWRAPELFFIPTENGQVRPDIAGYERDARPGHPELPQSSVLVALPPGARPLLTILEAQSEPINPGGPVVAAPFPAEMKPVGTTGEIRGGTFQQDRTVTVAETALTDAPLALFEIIGTLRGVTLGRAVFMPLRQTASGWQFTRYARVRIDFQVAHVAQPANAADPIVAQIRQQVVNPGQVVASRLPEQAESALAQAAPYQAAPYQVAPDKVSAGPVAMITINGAGLTQITNAALKAAGFPVDQVDPHMLQLWAASQQVAMEWDGDGDTIFSANERLIFYANPRFSRWTSSDVLLLKAGDQPGARIATRLGASAGLPSGAIWRDLTVEENIFYTPDFGIYPPGHDGDRWTGRRISRPGTSSRTFTFSLPSISAALPARLTLWMIGETDTSAVVDHHVAAAVNQTPLGTLDWDGKQMASSTFSVPAGLLKDGQNSLTLSLPGIDGVGVEGAWLDAFKIDYAQGSASLGTAAVFSGEAAGTTGHSYTVTLDSVAGLRVFDVTDPNTPQRLFNVTVSGSQISFGDGAISSGGADSGASQYAMAAESGLRQPAQVRLPKALQTANRTGADYLVITHPDFAPALAPLLQLRASQGMATAVEDVQSIYDQYGAGLPAPDAIRAFLADVYWHWSPRPTYVLLVGDGTNDPKQYQPGSSKTWIPPMLADVDPWVGETAADNLFVTVDGTDHLPDMAIGRLPVNSLAEAQTVVAKLINYETKPDFGLWTRRLALVADDMDPTAGDFAQLSDRQASLLPAGYYAMRAYYQPPANTSGDVQQSVISLFNSGVGVFVYNGHASIHQWGAENFFHITQIPQLTNAGRLPLLLEMDCMTASFQVSGYATLDESLLRSAQGGVVAAWGATGWGVGTGHEILAKSVLQDLYSKGQARIGLETMQAKLALSIAQPAYDDLLDTYTLLGDPASLIDVQGKITDSVYLSVITR